MERLAVLDLEPLELRRIKSDLTMYYKIYSNISAFPSNYLQRNNSVRTYYSRTKCEYLTQPFCYTQLFTNDFTCVSYAEARNRYRLDVRPSVCPSVRPSVSLSHAGTVSKRLICEILTVSRIFISAHTDKQNSGRL